MAKITIWAQLGVHLPHLKIICSFKGPEHLHCSFSLDICILSLGPICLGQGQKLSKGPKCSVWVLSARSWDQRLILGSKYSFWGQSATKETFYQLFLKIVLCQKVHPLPNLSTFYLEHGPKAIRAQKDLF